MNVQQPDPLPTEEQFQRIWRMSAAFDKRHPDPKRNYGIHGCELRMVLVGPLGATQFVLYTNWHLKHVEAELDRKLDNQFPHLSCHPTPADRGYHWRTPRYESQRPQDNCEYLGGAPCYYDGSSLNADDTYKLLLVGGSDAVWKDLEEFYRDMAERVEA